MPTREEERRLAEQEAAALRAAQQQQAAAPKPQAPPAGESPTEATRKFTETVPGGKYEVGGRTVDAHGNEVKGKAGEAEGGA